MFADKTLLYIPLQMFFLSSLYERRAPTSHSQAETLTVRKVDGDAAGPDGCCSPWHDEGGNRPIPLPGTQTTTSCQR